jgi:hypothetical protein
MRKVGTIGDMIRQHRRLYLACGSCGHIAEVDLDSLVLARGEGFTLQRLVELGRCQRCGRRNADLTTTPDLGEKGGYSYPAW